jgi:DNA polymerase
LTRYFHHPESHCVFTQTDSEAWPSDPNVSEIEKAVYRRLLERYSRPLRCHIDIESYSESDIKSEGAYKYAEHESTEILCLMFAFDDDQLPVIWIPWSRALNEVPMSVLRILEERLEAKYRAKFGCVPPIHLGAIPDRLRKHAESGGEFAAHNAAFERILLDREPGRRIGFPATRIEQWVCTAAKCRAAGLPGALGDACDALGSYPKDETGRGVMLQLCRPRTGEEKRYTYAEAAEKYAQLWTYCVDDVLAERGLDDELPDLVPDEREIYILDQLINDRGVGVDLEAIDHVQALIAEYKKELEFECVKMTTSEQYPKGLKPTQREKISEWVRAHGYPQIPDMTADTVRLAILDPKCPDDVKKMLKIYSTYGMKAVSKYDAMLSAVCRDSRIHGMFLFYGAGTGRWSSLIVQLQNLFRPVIKDADTAIDSFEHRDLDLIKFLYDKHDPMKVFASCVRGMLIPAEGHELQAVDYSGIESRVVAWLFDEHWKLEAFRHFDKDPKNNWDNYVRAVSQGFGIAPSAVTPFWRQIGKVMELSLGYEGGVTAFVTMAANYKIDLVELAEVALKNLPAWALDSAEWMWENIEVPRGNQTGLPKHVYLAIDGIKQVWREAHSSIRQGWKDINEAAKLTLETGKPHAIPNRKIIFGVEEWQAPAGEDDVPKAKWLVMKLPSGRKLRYFKPELHVRKSKNKKTGEVKVETHVTYMGVDTATRRWMRTGTYGGKLTENAVQAIAGDLLRGGMRRLEAAGYTIIMTVHDEVVSEIRRGFGSLKEAERIMCIREKWALDLPINAEGFRAKRFRK